MVAFLLALALAIVVPRAIVVPSAEAHVAAGPIAGHTPWAVILCKLSDRPQEPQAPLFFQQFMTAAGAGMGGMYDYWRDVSYSTIDLDGSVVKGWYTETYTWAQEQAKSRGQKIDDCIATARDARSDAYTVPAGYRVAVMLNAQIDSGSAGGRVILDPGAWYVTFAAHEMGHGYGLDHSFDNVTPTSCDTWGGPGEYCDPWDIMSAMLVHSFAGAHFGTSGPGLNGPYLDKLGWLPRGRIYTFGQDGAITATVTLAALNHPEATGYLMVRIPFDVRDLHHYYTIEFRRKTGWDAGIPRDAVLIHEVRADGRSYLVRTYGGPEWLANDSFADVANDVRVSILSLDSASSTATVSVSAGFADRCIQGYVWREASPTDHVCVTPQTRAQTRYDNSQAAARRSPNGGPSGPDTCRQGFVWREAFPGDHVCVTPQTRAQAKVDNSQAESRVSHGV